MSELGEHLIGSLKEVLGRLGSCKHVWGTKPSLMGDTPVCVVCGIVQNDKNTDRDCRGPVRVSTRLRTGRRRGRSTEAGPVARNSGVGGRVAERGS